MLAFHTLVSARTVTSSLVLAALSAGPALAECGAGAGSVRLLSNNFRALNLVAQRAEECASDGLTFSSNQTTEHADIQGPALTVNPAEYTAVIVANGSFTALMNEGLLRPLDDLVAEYGQDLRPNQLIKVDGHVMAVAFQANAQHLFYREDVLIEAGIDHPPTSWDEVLEDAETIRAAGIMQNPLAGTYAPGWELGQEFVNMYLGMGGELFEPGSAVASIDNETGIQALETMKALTGYMGTDYLTTTSDSLVPLFESGEVAMAQGWGSAASELMGTAAGDAQADQDGPLSEVRVAAAPTAPGGSTPATTVWWDGFAIARNISDEDAEASFRTMVHAVAPQLAADHPTESVWLMDGYQPGPNAAGVMASVQGGAPSYPTVPYMSLLHTAIDSNIAAFLSGSESAEKALADAQASYETAAREAGYLN